jgi:hypothetical protein
MTELGLDAEGLTETVLHLNLGYFLFVLFFSPLMRQQQNYFSDTTTGLEAGLTPKLLRLKLYCT